MKTSLLLVALLVVGLAPGSASAHCDTLDGPVVKAAQKALETGQLAPVLAWVKADDEAAIKNAFAESQVVRKLGPEAKALADRSFFETLVRLHRAGEGAPYTGLKPAGQPQPAVLVAADRAVVSGKSDTLAKHVAAEVKAGLDERWGRLRALPPPGADPAKGRAWVAAYVDFVHYVLGVERAVKGGHEAPVATEHGAHVD
jgi:hypothetical protein